MIGKDKHANYPSFTNRMVDIEDSDRQKLYEGFVVMAKILANEIAKEIAGNHSTNPSTSTEGIQSPIASSNSTLGKEKLAISCSEAAKILGLSRNTIYELVRQNKIPFIKYGKRILIPYIALARQFNNL